MMRPSEPESVGSAFICLDTSVLLEIPRLDSARIGNDGTTMKLPKGEFLFDVYVTMCDMVKAGSLAFPEQLVAETRPPNAVRMHDLARAFAEKAWSIADRGVCQPAESQIRNVFNLASGFRPTWSGETEADPYVIAIGLTQREASGRECLIASIDGPVLDCCSELGLPTLNTIEFIEAVVSWRNSFGDGGDD